MSLFMKYSDMWDKNLGGKNKENRIPHWFGNLVWVVVGVIMKVCFRYKVEHREKLRAFKDSSGVLVVCNHTSFLDVVVLYLAARPSQWIRFMGRDTLFEKAHGLLGQALSRVGAFPVKRDSADITSIKRAVRMLKNDEIVGVMPEGTRRGKTDRPAELYGGASMIARMAHVPILPMCVRGAEKVKNKGERIHFPKISVDFGDPILVSDFNFLPKEERLEGCTWYAMRESFAMFYNCAPEEVDMAELFPKTKDYTEVFTAHPIPHHTSDELALAARLKAAERALKKQQTEDAPNAHEGN
jgi:1-acyl-sn-glycerol-3-phosphate acyltransferase